MTVKKQELHWVPLGAIGENLSFSEEPFPPRPAGDVTDLTSDVRIHGIISPLLLRIRDGRYQIVCGYRRYLAAREAGLLEVPALVGDLLDAEAIRAYLSENIIRRPIAARTQEEALKILQRLRDGSLGGVEGSGLEAKTELGANRLAPLRDTEEAPLGSARPPGRFPEEHLNEEGPLGQIVGRMESFLAALRTSRSINVPEVELLTDAICDLAFEDAPFDFHTLTSGNRAEFTAVHSLLVAAFSARTGKHLQWSEEKVRALVTAGLLHDVGMVFLWGPVKLDKPQALSRAERVALRSHTRIGCALIAGAHAWPEEVSLSARDHHERWDGSGYPAGRIGEEVGPEARVMGLLDAYAASISERPHRRGLSPKTALERLSESVRRGLFDPASFSAFREALKPIEAGSPSIPWPAEIPAG